MCDELGILAWSELIFSDAFYPTNDFFLDSVEREVRQNVRRVNRHPSNAQWAGGNEIEVILPYAPLFFPELPMNSLCCFPFNCSMPLGCWTTLRA